MRKVLDLYANVRPVRVPAEGIDWTFFRENTEDLYAVGSEGFSLGDLNIDFKILSNPGSERIIRAAFDYAQNQRQGLGHDRDQGERGEDDGRRVSWTRRGGCLRTIRGSSGRAGTSTS